MSCLRPASRLSSKGRFIVKNAQINPWYDGASRCEGGAGQDEWDPYRSAPPCASRIFINLSIGPYIYQSFVAAQDADQSRNNFRATNFQMSALNLTGSAAFVSACLSTLCASATVVFIISCSPVIDCAQPGFSD